MTCCGIEQNIMRTSAPQEHKLQEQGSTQKSGLTKELACVDGYEVRQMLLSCSGIIALHCEGLWARGPPFVPQSFWAFSEKKKGYSGAILLLRYG